MNIAWYDYMIVELELFSQVALLKTFIDAKDGSINANWEHIL